MISAVDFYIIWGMSGAHLGHICSIIPAVSLPCAVTVSLSGLAKGVEGECEGECQETGLRSMGRQVKRVLYEPSVIQNYFQVFKLEEC